MFSLRLRTPLTTTLKSSTRSISISAVRGMPEKSQMSNGDPKTLEQEKQKNLKDQQAESPHEHAPRWNEALASESEAAVKADTSDKPVDPKALQGETIEHVKKVHGH